MGRQHQHQHQMSFAEIGTLYNTVANQLQGGVSRSDQHLVLNEISKIETQLQNLIDDGSIAPSGAVAVVHAQNIVDQMNFLTDQVKTFGSDAFNPKFINDVVRDVQDIVAGDDALTALAHQGGASGFQQVSFLLANPAPFPDTPLQTATLLQFIADSNSLSERAVALGGTDPNSADVQSLIHDIEQFTAGADAYSTAQGGLFSARFNNEFNLDGVQGTASREMISGLLHQDASLVNGAAEVLTANAADVRGNMLANGDTYVPPPNGGIPLDINTVQVAGQVFNDAVTKLLGGIHPANQVSVQNDLSAVIAGLQAAATNESITGKDLNALNKVIGLAQHELGLVTSITTPQQISKVADQIGNDQSKILSIVAHNDTLAGLTSAHDADNPGFVPLPPTHNDHGFHLV